MTNIDLPRRLAQKYKLPLQVAAFFSLLIEADCVTVDLAYRQIGSVECRQLTYRLRQRLKDVTPQITIHRQNAVGYWLDEDTRSMLAQQMGIELSRQHPRTA
mgnify:CR=1 FL=1